MSAFTHHLSFEFRTGIRNKTLLLLNYLFPLGFYLLAGAMLVGLNPGFRETMIPAMVFFAVLTSSMMGIPAPIVESREAGIYRSYKIHGIPELSILAIPALTTLLHMMILTCIIVVTAPLLFQASLPTDWLGFVLAFLLMALACLSLGLLVGVVSPNSQAATLLGMAIFLPSQLIGGLMFPTQMLPDGLNKLALLLPSTHAMNLYDTFARDIPYDLNPYLSTAALYVGAALAFGLAIYLFNWDDKNRTRRGHPALALTAILPYLVTLIVSLF